MLSKDAGDLVINGKLIEVKGNGGRIKGVRGYGNSSSTLTAVKAAAAALPKKLKLKTAINAPSNVNVGKTSDFWTNFGPSLIAAGAPAAGVVNFIRTSLSGIINSIYLDATPVELQQLVAPVNNKGMFLDNSLQLTILVEVSEILNTHKIFRYHGRIQKQINNFKF